MTEYRRRLSEVDASRFTTPSAKMRQKVLIVLSKRGKRSQLCKRIGHAIRNDLSIPFCYPKVIGAFNVLQILVPSERVEKKTFSR